MTSTTNARRRDRRTRAWSAAVLATLLAAGVAVTAAAPAMADEPAPAAATGVDDTGGSDDTAGPDDASATDDTGGPADTAGSDDATASADAAESGEVAAPGETPAATEAEGPAPAATPAASEPAAPAAPAPTASPGDATIIVHVGGDRTGTATVSGLPGVTLGLFADQADATPVAADWATATSDPDGVATFVVPADQIGPDTRYWVKATSAPAGYALNDTLTTAPITDPGSDTARAYAFQTPRLVQGGAYESGEDFMSLPAGGTDYTASTGRWALSRTNPALAQQCGMSVALVLDLSASVLQANATEPLHDAAETYVDALLGTPSQVQLFSFGTTASVESAPTPVSTQANVDALHTAIDALTPTSSSYTNWDDALWTVAQQPGAFDLTVVVTDGNPTVYGASQAGRNTRFAEVENGIFAANALKLEGTRVLALGVGDGVGSTDAGVNLRAISGDGAYVQSASYTDAGDWLREMVFDACTPSLTVVKQVDDDGVLAPAGGWTFDASTSSDLVSSLAGSGTTADGTGAVNFPVEFTSATAADAPITITERQQAGHDLARQDGRNAVCTVKNKDNPLGTALPVSDEGALGFTVAMGAGDMVSCTVVNTRLPAEPEPDVWDLALRVWVSEVHRDGESVYQLEPGDDESGPDYLIPYVEVQPGDLLTHDLRLFNQGDRAARVTQLVDYLPAGLELASGDDGWSLAANGNLYFDPATPIVLDPGEEIDVHLVLDVAADADTTDLIKNYAEISGFEGQLGAAVPGAGTWGAVDDVDSQADDDNRWVAAEAPGVKFEMNEIDEHDTTDEPDTEYLDLDNDQDDHDGDFLRVSRQAPPQVPGEVPPPAPGDVADPPVADEAAERPGVPGRLASTGASVGALAGLAAVVAAGGAAILVTRRRLERGRSE